MTGAAAQQDYRTVPVRRRRWIAGLPVDCLGEEEIVALFDDTVRQRQRIVLANLNLHGLYEALRTPVMGDLLRAPDTIVHIDGTPILWMARLIGGSVPPRARNGHIDLLPKILNLCAAAGWPVAIVGSDSKGAAENERALAAIAPGLRIHGFTGYFDLDDESPEAGQTRILDRIREIEPALLMVGMGMPRQEKWIAQIRRKIDVPVIMPVGGFADYFAGRTRTAPRFLGPLGLEWAYRLIYAPRRLGHRYLIEPFYLFGRMIGVTRRGARWGRERGSAGR